MLEPSSSRFGNCADTASSSDGQSPPKKAFFLLVEEKVNKSLLLALLILTFLEFLSYLNSNDYTAAVSDNPFQLTVYRPVDLSWLATISWLCWISPASFCQRFSFVIFMIFYCWLRSSGHTGFALSYLSYGSFVAAHAVVGDLVGLRGWHSSLQLTSQPKSPCRFSILYLLAAMSLVASLCIASQALDTATNTLLFFIGTIAHATSAVFFQHALTAERNNRLWAWLGFIAVVAGTGLITFVRSMNPFIGFEFSIFGAGGLMLVRYWFDVVLFTPVFIMLIALFAAPAGFQLLEQRMRPIFGPFDLLDDHTPTVSESTPNSLSSTSATAG